jgi:hypothetical protein
MLFESAPVMASFGRGARPWCRPGLLTCGIRRPHPPAVMVVGGPPVSARPCPLCGACGGGVRSGIRARCWGSEESGPPPGIGGSGLVALWLFGISIVDASIFVVVLLCRPRFTHSLGVGVGGKL